ncbi:MAG: hypothetical protein QOH79_1668 [Acidimicrobiaceae bacterium]|jgi:hypothetical protein
MLVVLGMHRSGTSSVTELLELAGMQMPNAAARFRPTVWNAHGNYENRALTRFNERLLVTMGGRWDAPPPLADGWPRNRPAAAHRREAARLFATELPSSAVWKDPRLCLVLPFWEHVLDVQFPAVLVLRHPMEVAGSLRRRDGFSTEIGVALWERYLRTALRSVAGHRVFTVRYDDVLRDPADFVHRVRPALQAFGLEPGDAAAPDVVREAADPELRHVGADDSGREERLSVEQRALLRLLDDLPETVEQFDAVDLGPETPATAVALAEHGQQPRATASPRRRSATRVIAERLRRRA